MDTARRMANRLAAKTGSLLMDDLSCVHGLDQFNKLSIQIADTADFEAACKSYMLTGNTQFEPVEFVVRDEQQGKLPVLKVWLTSGVGLVVKQVNDDEVMQMALPEKSDRTYFKVQQPGGATIYKVSTADSTGCYRVSKTTGGAGNEQLLRVHRRQVHCIRLIDDDALCRQVWLARGLKSLSLAFDSHNYSCALKDGTATGWIRPKLRSVSRPTMQVKLGTAGSDQVRAVMIAFGCVRLLQSAYNELYNLLAISCQPQL